MDQGLFHRQGRQRAHRSRGRCCISVGLAVVVYGIGAVVVLMSMHSPLEMLADGFLAPR